VVHIVRGRVNHGPFGTNVLKMYGGTSECGAEVERPGLVRKRRDRGRHGLVGLFEPQPGQVHGAGAAQQRAEQQDRSLLRHVEDDARLGPVRGPAQAPVLHVVEHQRAVGPVDPQPEPGPAGHLGGPGQGAEADPAADVAGGRDGLHDRAEAGGFGDGRTQPESRDPVLAVGDAGE
jgi:hypothetical protein